MSVAPVEPVVPGTPTEPPAAATTPPATPVPTAPVMAPEPAQTANPWDDPKAAEAEILKLRRENGSARTNAKAQAAEEARKELAASIGKILDPNATEPTDPAALTASLTESQAEAKRARVELAVFRNASTAGGDPAALLDSTSFLASLETVDPSDSAAVTAAMQAAIAANSRLGAASLVVPPAPNPAQGSSAAGPTAVTQLTRAELAGMSSEAIEQARTDGRLNTVLGIT